MQSTRGDLSRENSGRPAASEKYGESLTCTICADILEGAVSVQPCLHTFCGACISHWVLEKGHRQCPECRGAIVAMATNHRMKQVVANYLEDHPEAGRDSIEQQKMEQLNLVARRGGVVQIGASAGAAAATAGGRGGEESSDDTPGWGWVLAAAVGGAALGALGTAVMAAIGSDDNAEEDERQRSRGRQQEQQRRRRT